MVSALPTCSSALLLTRSVAAGSTVAPERVQVDEISEASAQAGVMFGGANPQQPLDPLAPLAPAPPAVAVHFHVTVPDGLQETTVSLVQTLRDSRVTLEVVAFSNMARVVGPNWPVGSTP